MEGPEGDEQGWAVAAPTRLPSLLLFPTVKTRLDLGHMSQLSTKLTNEKTKLKCLPALLCPVPLAQI